MAEYTDRTVSPTEKSLVQALIKRKDQLAKIRKPWETIHQDILDHLLPNTAAWYNKPDQEALVSANRIHDGYGLYALNTMVRGLMGQGCSSSILWFRMTMRPELMRNQRVAKHLQQRNEAMYTLYRESNYYSAYERWLKYVGVLGTGVMSIEWDQFKDRFAFTAAPPDEWYIARNVYGEIDTYVRVRRFDARNAVAYFGWENLPREVQYEAKEGDPYKSFEFVQLIFPRYDYIDGRLGPQGMPYVSYYIFPQKEMLIREGGFRDLPLNGWAWEVFGRETYGRGPGFNALVDLKGLQQYAKNNIESAQYAANPAWNVPEEMMGSLERKPKGNNYYEEAGRIISPIGNNANYQIGLDAEERKRRAIDEHFMTALFQMLSQIDREMTATEVNARMGEKVSVLSPVLARQHLEAHDPIHARLYRMASERGLFPDPPPELQDLAGEKLEMQYISPLDQLQQRLFDQQGIGTSLEMIGGISRFLPAAAESAMKGIKWPEFVQHIFRSNSVTPEIMNSLEDVYAQLQQEQQMAQQMAEAEQAKQMGAAAQGLKSRPESGSPLEAMMQGGQM